MPDFAFVELSPYLPHDLFHDYILPHILSDHLHNLLVAPEAPKWHAFYVLPLVSLAFHDTCQVLYVKIFGLENGNDIDDILTFTLLLWRQTSELPSQESQFLSQYTQQELMAGHGLIQVYICTAVARSFLNLDVVGPMSLQNRVKCLKGHSEAQGRDWDEPSTSHDDPETRAGLRLVDDLMHRVYLPFTCAISHCDSVRPERLAYIAADYLSELLPIYSTAPVLLKYAQDLETYVAREHRVEVETWATWAIQTLDLIGATKHLLKQIHEMGRLVRSFSTVSEIPLEALEATNIIKAVREVKSASWGTRTSEIRARASSLLQEWGITN